MTATTAMKAQVRRWVNEPTTATYTDDDIAAYIERYPLQDERGVSPYYYDTTTDPPTQVATTGWYPTYDLHAASADIWDDKAGGLSEKIDRPVNTPRQDNVPHSTRYDNAVERARYHRSRRVAQTGTLIQSPSRRRRGDQNWIGNLPEDFYD